MSTAHSIGAFCVGIKIFISIDCIVMAIFILTQNASFECAVEIPNSFIIKALDYDFACSIVIEYLELLGKTSNAGIFMLSQLLPLPSHDLFLRYLQIFPSYFELWQLSGFRGRGHMLFQEFLVTFYFFVTDSPVAWRVDWTTCCGWTGQRLSWSSHTHIPRWRLLLY